MSTRTIVLLCVGCGLFMIGLGLAASYVTSRLLADKNKEERVRVLVAKQQLTARTEVKSPAELFESWEIPSIIVPATYATPENQRGTIGCSLLIDMQRGEVLTWDHLSSPGKSKAIPTEQEANVVDIVLKAAPKEIITPGANVDVLLFRTGEQEGVRVLESVPVQSVKMMLPRPGDPADTVRARVTLDLEAPEQATLAKAKAQPQGRIVLELRTPR